MHTSRVFGLLGLTCLLASTLLLSACHDDKTGDRHSSLNTAAPKLELSAAGSSFIYPVLSRWADDYQAASHVEINYQPIGSGGGISQLKARVISFAASDEPLTPAQLQHNHWRQFPAIIGAIVPIVHLTGVQPNQLVLNGKVLADIYMGKVTKWNDPAITQLNPKLKLPASPIIAVHRADSSGTTYNFTYFLTQTNPSWKNKLGFSTNVNWSFHGNHAQQIGAKGNAGVAQQVQLIPGSIGYVEYAYAKSNHLTTTAMLNRTHMVVSPTPQSFAAAAANVHWNKKLAFDQMIANPAGTHAWPIDATTFVLVPMRNSKHVNQEILAFFRYAFDHGQHAANALHYVPLPRRDESKLLQAISIGVRPNIQHH